MLLLTKHCAVVFLVPNSGLCYFSTLFPTMLLVTIMDKMRSLELDWDKPSSICTKVSRGQGLGIRKGQQGCQEIQAKIFSMNLLTYLPAFKEAEIQVILTLNL